MNGPFIQFDEAKLLYSGKKERFAPCNYFPMVNDKPDTICIVRSKKGKVCGGYTDIPWTCDMEEHKNEGKTFLFNMKREKMTKFPHMPEEVSEQ